MSKQRDPFSESGNPFNRTSVNEREYIKNLINSQISQKIIERKMENSAFFPTSPKVMTGGKSGNLVIGSGGSGGTTAGE